jgi:hypothetical protein
MRFECGIICHYLTYNYHCPQSVLPSAAEALSSYLESDREQPRTELSNEGIVGAKA